MKSAWPQTAKRLGKLLTIADGDLPAGASVLRVKAVEASSAPDTVTRSSASSTDKEMFGWAHPRNCASLCVPGAGETRAGMGPSPFLPRGGIEREDLALAPLTVAPVSKFVRQRRHTPRAAEEDGPGSVHKPQESCSMDIRLQA